jgi:hypothetical protein
MDEVTPILTPKKKKIKVPTQNPPQKFVNFALTLRKIEDFKGCRQAPQKQLWDHPSEKFVHRV